MYMLYWQWTAGKKNRPSIYQIWTHTSPRHFYTVKAK